ncbi:MAG: MMPL family transporter [Bdellovibrionota bacterium]
MKQKPSTSWTDKYLLSLSTLLAKLPSIIIKHRWKNLFIYLAITIFFLAGVPKFKINQAFDAFFTKEDKTLKNYNWLKYIYGSDEFILVMFKPKDGDVFSEKSLKILSKIEDEINRKRNITGSKISRIVRVRSIISADYLESKNDTLLSRPFIGKNLPQTQAESDLLRQLAQNHPDFPGQFISKDSQFGVMLLLTDFSSKVINQNDENKQNDKTITSESEFDFDLDNQKNVKKILTLDEIPLMESVQMDQYSVFVREFEKIFQDSEWQDNFDYYLSGNPIIMTFFSDVIIKELGLYGFLSLVIIWIVMIIIYRSLSAMVWPSIILISAIFWTIGLIGWTGLEMTFMINIIVILLLAVSMATSIHIMSGYGFFQRQNYKNEEALNATYKKSGIPILLASTTTAAGLFSFLAVPIPSIQNFGLFAGIGVLLALSLNLFLWPIFISFWAPSLNERQMQNTSSLARFLASHRDRTLNHRKIIIAIFTFSAIAIGIGIKNIYIDTNFVEMIKDDYDIVKSYRIIDKYFGGTAQLDVLVDTGKADGVKSVEVLKAIENFSSELEQSQKDVVNRTSSIVKAVKESYKNLTDGSDQNYHIPDSDKKVSQVLFNFESADPTSRKLLVEDNWQVARITVSVPSKGTYDYKILLQAIESLAAKHFGALKKSRPGFNIRYTGGIQLMTELLILIATSQIQSFSIALIIISIMLFFLYGSIKMGIIAMIPNVFPIIIVLGAAGWLGIPLDNDTLLVVPIAIGIAVDDTIHFLTHYRAEVLEGLSSSDAIDSSLRKVGSAMTMTTVVLMAGYLVYLFSAYKPLTNFGILSSLAVTSALLADLFLLPVLIHISRPFQEKES